MRRHRPCRLSVPRPLRSQAIDLGITADAIDAAYDNARPKDELIRLILAQLEGMQAQHSAAALGQEAAQGQAFPPAETDAALQAEISQLKSERASAQIAQQAALATWKARAASETEGRV